MTEPVRIVDKPSHPGFYQGYTYGTTDEVVAEFIRKFGRPPAEIVRSTSAGSIILVGPVLNEHIEEMRKPHPRQTEIDNEATLLLRRRS